MKKRSIWLVIGLLIASVAFTLTGCRKKKNEPIAYTLSETEIVLTVGETKMLTLTPAPEVSVSWETGNAAIATVEDGTVTAVAEGTVTVTATVENGEAPLSCSVTVQKKQQQEDPNPPAGGGYSLDFTTFALKTGETKQLGVLDKDGNPVTTATFTSADATIASVSESGLVTAVKAGSTTIKAKVGEEELTCSVTVAQKYTYSLDKSALDVAAGGSDKLTLNVSPELEDGARPHTFSSSDTSIATVDGGSGKVTGVTKGTATITCLVDGEELTATVTVTEYTVKIGDDAFGAETALRVGVNQDITVTADPARTVEAVYDSSDKTVATVENGHIVPLKEGSTTITVTVGGRTFTMAATVSPSTIYEINKEEVTLKLSETDNTVQLEVTRDPEGEFEVEYESSDETVAAVSASGLVTAKKLGTATITATIKGTEVSFTVEISVVLDSELTYEDYTFGGGSVNLTRLDENKTLDWRMWYAEDGYATRMKDKTDLIGDVVKTATDEKFWDYKAPIFYEDGDNATPANVYTYGRAVHGSYSIPVKLTNAVSKVIILTGSWKEAATIEFKIGDAVLQSEEFSAGDVSLARGYALTVDTSALSDGELLDLTIDVNCARSNGGNVSLVAVAVVGKTAHEHAATASTTAEVTTGLTGAQNLTEAGGIDWASANGTVKAGVAENSIINVSGIAYAPNKGTAHDYSGATITWTDGTAAAPENLKTFCHADKSVTIPVHLDKGKATVTVWATGWNCGYLVAVYDENGTFVGGYQGADEKNNASVSSKLAIALDVKESGEYTFQIVKCRGAGNIGWAAIAVSSENAFEPSQLAYDLTKGDEASITLTGEGTAPAATYTSEDETIATVDENGKITALKAGKTYITVAYAGVERKITVTVTEYKISSATSVSLFIGGKSSIQIVSDPAGHTVNATYELAAGEDKITVSESGEIIALKAGEAQVTVKVDGKEIGKVTVSIAGYMLNETEQTIVTASGTSTFKLEVITNTDTGAVADPAQVTFASSNDDVVTVAVDGTVTAVGAGEATVTATYDGVDLTCTVTACVLPVTTQVIDYADSNNTVNLTKLDETKATLDWHYFGNGFKDEMKGGSLIGELSTKNSSTFNDYRAQINWSNGTVRESSFNDLTDGWTFAGKDTQEVSFTVSLTDKVDYIAVFLGAYHAKNTVEVRVGDKLHATYVFENLGNNDGADKNKQLRIYPDVTDMKTAQTVTVTMKIGAEASNGWKDNVSLVAIAVVGKDARPADPVSTAAAEATLFAGLEDAEKTVNLSEVGTLDWVYVKNGNDGGVTRKAGVIANSIIKADVIKTQGGAGYDWVADGMRFTWTDGVNAPAGETVNNFQWINNKYYIPVHLPKGESEVTLYLSGWKCSYFVTVLDDYGNKLIDAQRIVEGNGSSSQAAAVKVTVNAAEAGTFTFLMTKDGDGNHGWAAVTVAQKSEYSLTSSAVNATLGGNAPAAIEVKKGGEAVTEGIAYSSSDESVVTVSASGAITAHKAGNAVITVTVDGSELLVFVHVTEYVLDSSDNITLPLEKTSQITILANPEGAINATYASDDDEIATVSESGLITAVKEGTTKITVTIDGKTFEITLNAVSYKLNKEEITLTAGATCTTETLAMQDGENNNVQGVTYESKNPAIATVSEDGTVTAVAVGTTTVEATVNGVTLSCTVTVNIPDTQAVLTELNMDFVNLSRLSPEYKTIDYAHWSNEDKVLMPEREELIGLVDGADGNFWDYKATVGYEYTEGGRNLGKCYGKISHNGFTLPVTINNHVSEIVFLTGAYKCTATITFKLGERTIGTATFTADDGIARMVSVKLDTSKLTDAQTLTIIGTPSDKTGDGNVNVVAVAVIGKEAYSGTEIVAATGTVSTQKVGEGDDKGGNKVDLTEVGTLDWRYSHWEPGDTATYRKFGGSVLTDVTYYNNEGDTANAAAQWDGYSAFKWSDGIMIGAEATEGTVNPADASGESWDGHDEYTNNYYAASGEIHIGMHLTAGKYKVTAYLNSWKADISAAIYDGNNNFVAGKIMINYEPGNGTGWVVTFELEVTAESDFTVVIGKSRSHGAGDRQVGWQAIAVAALPDEQ